jgi:ABC-type sulfate transport system permease subunit
VTYSLKTSLEAMARRVRGVLAIVVPPTITCGVVLVLLIAAHRLAGTRELWSTIAVPYAASSTYAWVYALLLARRS